MNRSFLFISLILFAFILSSCSIGRFAKSYYSLTNKKRGSLSEQVYTTELNSYQIGELGKQWRRIKVKSGDLVFYNDSIDTVLTVNSDCRKEKRKYSLKALSNSLVVGIKDKEILDRYGIDIDKSSGLFTRYSANINGEIINLATVVYKSNKCNYDFSYSASKPDDLKDNIDYFFDFLAEFKELSVND